MQSVQEGETGRMRCKIQFREGVFADNLGTGTANILCICVSTCYSDPISQDEPRETQIVILFLMAYIIYRGKNRP